MFSNRSIEKRTPHEQRLNVVAVFFCDAVTRHRDCESEMRHRASNKFNQTIYRNGNDLQNKKKKQKI